MSKKKKNAQPKKAKEDKGATLKDTLDASLLEQLQQTKKALETEENEQKRAEAKRKEEERKQKEKNKSFEELLNESNLSWKTFKDS
ncbi:YqkE family protein [Bacillus sp. 2205SS5-2]|uniref:YqkE family protein n=1 Tax=Bacillus sp. 2205SS5-2 TaxID=3109031 RepID=UPI0030046E80